MFRLDKTKFSMGKVEEQNQIAYWKDKSPTERLDAACYLISVAFDFDTKHPPKVDRTKFSCRKRDIDNLNKSK